MSIFGYYCNVKKNIFEIPLCNVLQKLHVHVITFRVDLVSTISCWEFGASLCSWQSWITMYMRVTDKPVSILYKKWENREMRCKPYVFLFDHSKSCCRMKSPTHSQQSSFGEHFRDLYPPTVIKCTSKVRVEVLSSQPYLCFKFKHFEEITKCYTVWLPFTIIFLRNDLK